MNIKMVIPCLLGLEGLIAAELRELGAADVAAENGRVFFAGDANILARANICSRFAERVQIVVGRFTATTFDELFDATKALPWEEWLDVRDAFPVKGYSINSALFSTSDLQSIIKKAVVTRLKQVHGQVLLVETGAVHQIQFALQKDNVLLTLDTSGTGLHKRGYRLQAGGAPLKETLAAALCSISRLRPYHTLYDPMCGSGTILIEGALMAANIAPGVNRPFAAERWPQLPREVWQQERDRAKSLVVPAEQFAAHGTDLDPAMLDLARENAKRAGVASSIAFVQGDVTKFAPVTDRGTVITNPPYGERLGDVAQAEQLITQLGQAFEQKRGFSYTMISSCEQFEPLFGRKADARRKLYNGMMKCNAFMYYK